MFSGADASRTAALLSTALIISFSATWIIAVIIDGAWEFGVNMISDLGVSATNAHYVFGWGSIASGILAALTGYALSSLRGSTADKAPFFLLMFAGMMLMLVGIFPEGTAFHFPAALSLFIAVWISTVLLAVRDLRAGECLYGSINTVLALLNVILLVAVSLALYEALGVIMFLLWTSMLAHGALTGARGYGRSA